MILSRFSFLTIIFFYLSIPCFAQGIAHTQEDQLAAQIAMQKAEQGDAEAQYILGVIYQYGSGVVQNSMKAFLWYEKAASQGYRDAQVALAWMYDTGNGAPQDYYKAAQWYKKSALQGDPESQNRLAYFYIVGLGVVQDYEQALFWCNKAVKQNYGKAQVQLAMMYALGDVVPMDLIQAYKWASIAAMRGQKQAVILRDDLEKQMTPAQIAEAQRLAREWKPNKPVRAQPELNDDKELPHALSNTEIETKLRASRNFIRISLPQGLSFELPRNWVVLSKNQRITIDTFVETIGSELLGDEAIASDFNFAANLFNDHKQTIGILNVRFYPEIDIFQEQVRAFSLQDMPMIDKELQNTIMPSLEQYGMSIISWNGTIKKEINGIVTLITEYYRAGLKNQGNFRVQLIRVWAGDKSFTLIISYNENEEFLLKPITVRIINSIHIEGIKKVSSLREISPDEIIVLDSGEVISGRGFD